MSEFNPKQEIVKKQPIFNIPLVIIIIVAFCALVFLIPNYFFSIKEYRQFILYYAFVPQLFSAFKGQLFYTLLTYSFMHGSIMHILLNMLWLIIFGTPLVNRIGVIRFLLFWCVCAIASAIAHYIVYSNSSIPIVGASGAISGFMGAAARYGFHQIRLNDKVGRAEFVGPIFSIIRALKSRSVLIFICLWLGINLATGLFSMAESLLADATSIAWVAHIGGFAAGFFLIGFFDRRPINL